MKSVENMTLNVYSPEFLKQEINDSQLSETSFVVSINRKCSGPVPLNKVVYCTRLNVRGRTLSTVFYPLSFVKNLIEFVFGTVSTAIITGAFAFELNTFNNIAQY